MRACSSRVALLATSALLAAAVHAIRSWQLRASVPLVAVQDQHVPHVLRASTGSERMASQNLVPPLLYSAYPAHSEPLPPPPPLPSIAPAPLRRSPHSPPPPPSPSPSMPLPRHVAFLNPSAVWWRQPSGPRDNGVALVVARRFDGTNTSTWYHGHAQWRAGSIRNFVGESCLVGALATTDARGRLRMEVGAVHYVHDCIGERSKPWRARSRIEDARAFRRADGGLQLLYSSPMGGDAHAVYSAPIEVNAVPDASPVVAANAAGRSAAADREDPRQLRATVRLDQRVALCADLLVARGLPAVQKNWSPFVHGGADYIVYSFSPLRVWRVDHVHGQCTEANAVSSTALDEVLSSCNDFAGAGDEAAVQAMWRRCTGSSRKLRSLPADRQHFSLSIGGGTPGVVLPMVRTTGGSHGQRHARGDAAKDALASGASTVLFLAHSRLYAASSLLLRLLAPRPPADVGPEREWHQAYNKRYHALWITLRCASDPASGTPSFEVGALSRLFTPPNTRVAGPKIVFPTGLLLVGTDAVGRLAPGATLDKHPGTRKVPRPARLAIVLYGELDVYSHAWTVSLQQVRARLLMPHVWQLRVANGSLVHAWPQRNAQSSEMTAALYTAPSPVGAEIDSRANVGEGEGAELASMIPIAHGPPREIPPSCHSRGFELLWNVALVPFQGAPRPPATADADGCSSDAVQRHSVENGISSCCALCHQHGQQCSSWTYFAPVCYWTPPCQGALDNPVLMWGAISGHSSKRLLQVSQDGSWN